LTTGEAVENSLGWTLTKQRKTRIVDYWRGSRELSWLDIDEAMKNPHILLLVKSSIIVFDFFRRVLRIRRLVPTAVARSRKVQLTTNLLPQYLFSPSFFSISDNLLLYL